MAIDALSELNTIKRSNNVEKFSFADDSPATGANQTYTPPYSGASAPEFPGFQSVEN